MNIEELTKKLDKKIEELAVIKERTRIMTELEQADLPFGTWPMIKDIINPRNDV